MNNPLVVDSLYTKISVQDRQLCIDSNFEDMHLRFAAHRCPHDVIVLSSLRGSVSLESARLMSKTGVGLLLLDWNGSLLSTLLPRNAVSAKLKTQQYRKYLDQKARKYISSVITNFKINKQKEILLRLSEFYPVLDKQEIEKSFDIAKSKFKGNYEMLNLEGSVALWYWSHIKILCDSIAPSLHFTFRNGSRHSWNMSANDIVNACFNYMYSLSEHSVRKFLNASGFEISCGYLHELKDGRDSLVYDVLECFRFVADLSVLQLIQEGLTPADGLVTSEYHVRLKSETCKRLVEKFRINMNTRSLYRGRQYTLENILYQEVIRGLVDYIMDKKSTLNFALPEIELKRSDDSELRNRILNMNPEERRRLGIRRNTLHYMKKNIASGKPIRIYPAVRQKLAIA